MTKNKEYTLTVTGLRSHKLFGDNYSLKKYIKMVNDGIQFLIDNPRFTRVNIGMATGSDLLFGLAAINYRKAYNPLLEIDLYIPGINQSKYYSEKEVEIYCYMLANADNQIMTSFGECTPKALKDRNKEMVDKCDEVLAFWDYNKVKSGTWSTINYATKKNKIIHIIDPINNKPCELYSTKE